MINANLKNIDSTDELYLMEMTFGHLKFWTDREELYYINYYDLSHSEMEMIDYIIEKGISNFQDNKTKELESYIVEAVDGVKLFDNDQKMEIMEAISAALELLARKKREDKIEILLEIDP